MATDLYDLLGEYEKAHQNPFNRTLHKIFVPVIVWSILAALSSVLLVGSVSLGHVVALLIGWYYTKVRKIFAFLLTCFGLFCVYSGTLFGNTELLYQVTGSAFVIGWIGQFVGHIYEGSRPSFFKDLQFLLIGPLWILLSAMGATEKPEKKEYEYKTFDDFWPFYLTEHSHPTNRYLHIVGTGLTVLIAVGAIVSQNSRILLILPLLGYGFAWFGHVTFEKNKPATFSYPIWSLISDYKMFFMFLIGRLDKELELAHKRINKQQKASSF